MDRIRPATMRDVDAIAGVLARAFRDDPGTIVFEPDPVRRTMILPAFFRNFAAAAIDDGADMVVAGDPPAGVATWYGPGYQGPSEAAFERHGLDGVIEAFGPAAAERMLAMVGEIETRYRALMTGPHLHLEFFGVEPARQGLGLGSALIAVGHERADALGLPCYLETFTDADVGYYGHRGYRVVAEYAVGDGVPVRQMIRLPGG